jgi:hypothetical protein
VGAIQHTGVSALFSGLNLMQIWMPSYMQVFFVLFSGFEFPTDTPTNPPPDQSTVGLID